MIIRDIRDAEYFRARDLCLLCELLHPKNFVELIRIRCSLAHAVVRPREATLPHRLRESGEVYYILSGSGVMHIGDETAPVHEGQAIYIPLGSVQFIENSGTKDLVFLAIVDPAWREEDEEILDREPSSSRQDSGSGI
jgi:cytosine deaminase